MDLEARKKSFVKEFLRIQNEEIISNLENFLRKQKSEMKPLSIAEFNSDIDKSLEDIKMGRITEAPVLIDEILKWS